MLQVPHIKALAMAYRSRTDNKDIHALHYKYTTPHTYNVLCERVAVYRNEPLLELIL